MFIAVYIPFLIFPACCIWRMWDERPFDAQPSRSACRRFVDVLVALVMVATFAVYFYYVFVWFRRYTDW